MSIDALWSAATSAAADAYTMGTLGVPSPVLIERASLCVADEVQQRAQGRPVVCLVGPGNNGADALAVARICRARGCEAAAWLVTEHRNEAAQAQLAQARAHGVVVLEDPSPLPTEAVWVDGLLGTGSTGAPRGAVADALARVFVGPTVAIDVPSGVEVDSGGVPGPAFRADVTVTFVRSKLGLHVTPGRDFAGQVVVADIGITPPPEARVAGRLLMVERVASILARVPDDVAHKGRRGHVAVVGGSPDTPGAAVLAGTAAMRAGAGLCTLVGAAVPGARPELMRARLEFPVVPAASVLVVGPGLTEPPTAPFLARLFVDDPRPAVWDASALDEVPLGVAPSGPRVITPHPGEAARMLRRIDPDAGWSSATVQADRVRAAEALCRASGAVTVLKGAGTLVVGPGGLSVATEGTAALATAGSGDVLAGCIAGLLGQGLDAEAAAGAGVSVHGRSGTLAGLMPLALEIADAVPGAIAALRERDEGARDPSWRWG